jgi:diketogulonate reductase-like aldo/keto reductase
MAEIVPSVTLNNGVEMPQLGFGVFQIPDSQVTPAVLAALECGYRSIDTAAGYENESGVGKAIASSGIPREEIFVTTKLANHDHGYQAALRAFDESLRRLDQDYVDLYLIHWPIPAQDLYVETWRAFEKIYADRRARSIGVSNFLIPHLQRLLDETEVTPVVNQIEIHPYHQQQDLRRFGLDHGILPEAYSPLAQGGVLEDPVITRLASKHGKTPAQVVLRWHIEIGNIVIPKSVTPARIKENFDIFDFELTPDEVTAINALEREEPTGEDPMTFP